MQFGHSALDGLIVATAHLNAKDVEQLVVVGLNEERFHSNKVGQLMARDIEDELGTLCLHATQDLGQETLGGVGGQRAANDQAGHIVE